MAVENKTCTVQLPSGPTNFRITTVKPYLQEPPNIDTPALHDLDALESDLDQPAKDVTNDDNKNNIDAANYPVGIQLVLTVYLPDFKTWLIYLYF